MATMHDLHLSLTQYACHGTDASESEHEPLSPAPEAQQQGTAEGAEQAEEAAVPPESVVGSASSQGQPGNAARGRSRGRVRAKAPGSRLADNTAATAQGELPFAAGAPASSMCCAALIVSLIFNFCSLSALRCLGAGGRAGIGVRTGVEGRGEAVFPAGMLRTQHLLCAELGVGAVCSVCDSVLHGLAQFAACLHVNAQCSCGSSRAVALL